MSQIKAKLLLSLKPEEAERLPQAKSIIAQAPEQFLEEALSQGGGFPKIIEARDKWWRRDGLPTLERDHVIGREFRGSNPAAVNLFNGFCADHPKLMTSIDEARNLAQRFNNSFASQLNPATLSRMFDLLGTLGTPENRIQLMHAFMRSNTFQQDLRAVNERIFSNGEYFSYLGSRASGITPENALAMLSAAHAEAQNLVNFETTLPAACNLDLAGWYYHWQGRNSGTNAFFNANHQNLALLNPRHPNQTANVFGLQTQNLSREAQIMLNSSQLNAVSMDSLSNLLQTATPEQRTFLQNSVTQEWSQISNTSQRTQGLLENIRNGNYAYANMTLASSYLTPEQGREIDQYLVPEILPPQTHGELNQLADELRQARIPFRAITARLETLWQSVEAPAPRPEPTIQTTAPAEQHLTEEELILRGLTEAESHLRGFFGNNAERALDLMAGLTQRNRDVRNFIMSYNSAEILQQHILPAVRATNMQDDVEFQLEHFTHLLRHTNQLELYTNPNRITRGVELAELMSSRLGQLGIEFDDDTNITRPALMRAIFFTRTNDFTRLTDPEMARTMAETLSRPGIDDVEARGLNSRLYYRAIARCPEVTRLLHSTEGLNALQRLNQWTGQNQQPLGMADEYLFQLGQGGEKSLHLGRLNALTLLNQLGQAGLYTQMQDLSPRALIHPLLVVEEPRTRNAVREFLQAPPQDQVDHMTAERFHELLMVPQEAERPEAPEAISSREPSAAELRRETIWRIRGHVFVNPRLMTSGIQVPMEFQNFHQNVNAQAIVNLNLPYPQEEIARALSNAPQHTTTSEQLLEQCSSHPILSVLYSGAVGQQSLISDLRNLRDRGILLNVQNPTLSEQYRLSGSIPFETTAAPWLNHHNNIDHNLFERRFHWVRSETTLTINLANIISNMPDHTIDNESIISYCASRRQQLNLPQPVQDMEDPVRRMIQNSLAELRGAGILIASSHLTQSINPYILQQIPQSYGSHLGADALSRGYSLTNYGIGQNPALTYHPAVASHETEIEEAVSHRGQSGGIRPAQETDRILSVCRIASNMHMNVKGVAKREHIIHHFNPQHNPQTQMVYSEEQVVYAVSELHRNVHTPDGNPILHRTETGYYSLTPFESTPEVRQTREAEAIAAIGRLRGRVGPSRRDEDTIRLMEEIVHFTSNYTAQFPHTFRLIDIRRLWEEVHESSAGAPIADLPQCPRQVSEAVATLARSRTRPERETILVPVQGMEAGVYQINPNLQKG